MNFLLLLIVLSYTNYYYFVVIFSYLLGSFPLSLVFCSLILVGESVDLLFHFPWFFKILLDHRYLISFIISINLLALGFFLKICFFPTLSTFYNLYFYTLSFRVFNIILQNFSLSLPAIPNNFFSSNFHFGNYLLSNVWSAVWLSHWGLFLFQRLCFKFCKFFGFSSIFAWFCFLWISFSYFQFYLYNYFSCINCW